MNVHKCSHRHEKQFILKRFFSVWNNSRIFIFVCVGVLPVCIPVQHTHAWCLRRPESDTGSPGTGVTGDCAPPWGCSAKQPVSLTIEPASLALMLKKKKLIKNVIQILVDIARYKCLKGISSLNRGEPHYNLLMACPQSLCVRGLAPSPAVGTILQSLGSL